MDSVLIIKVISALLYPLGLFMVLHLLALFCRKSRPWRGIYLLIAWSVLLISSSPIVATALVTSLEKQFPQVAIEKVPVHDVIVVLGGGLRIPLPLAKYTQLSSGSDRYWHAVRLYNAGKAKRILLAGGNVFSQLGFQGESYYAAELLVKWGVPRNAIQSETLSRTTEQNQARIDKWMQTFGLESVLLVTSAYHMPRALEMFRDSRLTITPASADILMRESKQPGIFAWIPSASALSLTTLAVHEYLGLSFIRLKRALGGL